MPECASNGYRRFMGDILCNISAFRFHRVPPQVQMLLPMLPTPELDPNRRHLSEHPLVSEILGSPVHMLRDARTRSRSGARIIRHVWSGELPACAIMDTNLGIETATPLFTLLTMAPSVSEYRLIMAMYEMCGTFCVFQPSKMIESLLDRAYGERTLDPSYGWKRLVDASGRKTNLWKRSPLIELDELAKYACAVTGMRGAKGFTKAATAVSGVAASPFEVQGSMLLGMSRRRGGNAFDIENNVQLTLNRGARLVSGREKRYGDIVITSKDGTRSVVLEFQGEAFHGSVEAKIMDADRTTSLQIMGYQVIQVTYGQIHDAQKYSELVGLIERLLGMEHRGKTYGQREREMQMRREIFAPWESF